MPSRPRRVAFVGPEHVTETPSGGLANYTHRTARGLQDFGVAAEVFFPSREPTASFLHEGIRVHRLNWRSPIIVQAGRASQSSRVVSYARSLVGGATYYANVGLLMRRALRTRHAEAPFDVVQYSHLIGLGAWRSTIPTVVRLSSHADLWEPFGYVTSRLERFLEDLSLRRADAVFGPSRWVAEYASKKLRIPVDVIESPFVAPSTPEDPSLYESSLRGKKYALYFGAFTEYKGVYLLADAAVRFLAAHPDYHFVWIGPNRKGYEREGKTPSEYISWRLREHAARVVCMDELPHAKLFPIVRHARFVAMPSLAENFPNACIEAMHLGQVVIGTEGRSFEQLIEDGRSGFLCTPGDVESLLAAMERAAAVTDEEHTRIGERARARIDALRPEVTVAKLLELYARVSR